VLEDRDLPDWSPVGNEIAFDSERVISVDPLTFSPLKILVINTDGTGQKQLITDTDGPEIAPDWSPDGSKIAYMCRPTGASSVEICVVDRNGSNRRVLTNNSIFDATPVWSPDGKQILILRPVLDGNDRRQQLWVMNADGSNQRQLTHANDPGVTGAHAAADNSTGSWGLLKVTAN
jgi:TolB protein